jgi:type II secretory pathway pseudopilin PulG
MTLVELLLAAALLAIAAVPIIQAATQGLDTAREIEMRTRAALLAQQKMESILAAAGEDYSQNFSRSSEALGNGYLATVLETPKTSVTKTIALKVGYDKNKNGVLGDGEVQVSFATVLVNRGG